MKKHFGIAFAILMMLAGLAYSQGQIPSPRNLPYVKFSSFVFANIATRLPTDGMIGYCSDCTIASPCAGGGTGAIAKRLNGVQVCN